MNARCFSCVDNKVLLKHHFEIGERNQVIQELRDKVIGFHMKLYEEFYEKVRDSELFKKINLTESEYVESHGFKVLEEMDPEFIAFDAATYGVIVAQPEDLT